MPNYQHLKPWKLCQYQLVVFVRINQLYHDGNIAYIDNINSNIDNKWSTLFRYLKI